MKPVLPRRSTVAAASLPHPVCAQKVSSFRVTTAPGESLHVVRAGSGQPVVLLPGLFGCAFGFRHLLAQLPPRGNRVTVIEPLAIGSSSRPERANYSLTAQADRIAVALRKLEAEPVVLVAHSLSASIALRLAIRHPELVKGVVLLDGGPMETVATKGFRQAMRYAPWVKWMGGMKRLRPHIRKDLIASSADSTWLTDAVLQAYTAGAAADLDGTLKAYLRMAKTREPEKLAPRLHQLQRAGATGGGRGAAPGRHLQRADRAARGPGTPLHARQRSRCRALPVRGSAPGGSGRHQPGPGRRRWRPARQ